ncbi:MAG: asparaginase domain-containing protein [Crocinitomicaceae bacterium]|nr:asparaginase domain-containing protein [Crocinitomicaceae bacterium]
MQIAFIQTGGTIDKDYPKVTKGWAFEIAEPAFNRILEKLNPSFSYQSYEAFKKDSQEITSKDRAKLKALCKSIAEDKIIITHGTDTMAETARSLSSINKTIIVTGAMKPERFSNSDAPINLGAAIAACQTLTVGSYLVMHGMVIPHNQVERDLETGKYYINE